jgi:hypothetical protein
MKNRNAFAILAILTICFLPMNSKAEDADVEMIRNLNSPYSTHYFSVKMASVVNRLRHLDKDRALDVLRSDLSGDLREHPQENVKVVLICRLLIVNPSGWKPLDVGLSLPHVDPKRSVISHSFH